MNGAPGAGAEDAPDAQDGRLAFPLALVVAGVLIAIAWRTFNTWREPTYILTSLHGMRPLAPIYAFLLPRAAAPWILGAAALLLLGALGGRLLRGRREVLFLVFAVVFSATFRFAVHASRSGRLPGTEFTTYAGEDVIYDVSRIVSPGDFLRDYASIQPQLSLHGRTKPPGFALIHYAILKTFGDDVTLDAALLTFIASLVVLPAYLLGKNLRGRPEDGRAAALLAATAPGSVAFGAVSLDAVFAVVAAAAFAAALLEMRRPDWRKRVALGLLLFIGMMLSYSTFIVGFLCALLLLLDRAARPLVCLDHLAQVLGLFLLPFLLLYLYPSFDAWECFRNARRLNAETMGGVIGHALSGPGVWIYCSLGNLLAFLIYLGLPVVASWGLLPSCRLGRTERIVATAFGLTLVAACFGGIYLMETERILVFLVPVAILPALLPRAFRPGVAMLLAGAQAIAMEALFFTLW